MNHVISSVSIDAHSARQSDESTCDTTSLASGGLTDLLHEIRQPLSVIESLAYYLELTSKDDKVGTYLKQIQAMVRQANQILTEAKVY